MHDGLLDAAIDGARVSMRRFGVRALAFAAAITFLAVRDGHWSALLLAPMLGLALAAGGATAFVMRHATRPLQQTAGGNAVALLSTALVTVGVVAGLLVACSYAAVRLAG